jgi:periplasmic protein TonB
MEFANSHILPKNTAPVLNLLSHFKTNYMNKELIMKTDVIDILFENRNKAYGAYDLRKHYAERLNKAFVIMMTIAASFAALTFLLKKTGVVNVITFSIPQETIIPTAKENIKEPEVKPTPVKQKQQMTIAAQTKFTKPEVVENTVKTDVIDNIKENVAIGNTTIDLPGAGPAKVQPEVSGTGDVVVPVPPKPNKSEPLEGNTVDVLPAYPGGMDALRKFLEKHLQNPRDMEEGELVSVRIKFVVGYDGKLQSFVTVLDGGAEFNKEVIRVLKKMPDWIPGKAKGENVSVYYTIPVKFVPAN